MLLDSKISGIKKYLYIENLEESQTDVSKTPHCQESKEILKRMRRGYFGGPSKNLTNRLQLSLRHLKLQPLEDIKEISTLQGSDPSDGQSVSKYPEQFSTQQVNWEYSETSPPDSQWKTFQFIKKVYLCINM